MSISHLSIFNLLLVLIYYLQTHFQGCEKPKGEPWKSIFFLLGGMKGAGEGREPMRARILRTSYYYNFIAIIIVFKSQMEFTNTVCIPCIPIHFIL